MKTDVTVHEGSLWINFEPETLEEAAILTNTAINQRKGKIEFVVDAYAKHPNGGYFSAYIRIEKKYRRLRTSRVGK